MTVQMNYSSDIMVPLLHFSIGRIQGVLPLDDTMYLVRMVLIEFEPGREIGIVGTLNLHGIRVPVYSLFRLFGLPDHPPRPTDTLIMVKPGPSEIALWVNETFVVQDTKESEGNGITEGNSAIPGMVFLSNGQVFIHDLSLFLKFCNSGDITLISSVIGTGYDRELSDNEHSVPDYFSGDPDQMNAVLAERAFDLAKPVDIPSETSSFDILKFRLVYQEYAIEMRYVREVVLTREITPVPGTPDHVIGVFPVRGEIIPLVDLRVLLSIPEKGLTDLNQVIILSDGTITFGILTDQITGISTIPRDKIQASGTTISPDYPGFFLGRDSSGLMIVNASVILSDPKMIVDHSGELDQANLHLNPD